MTLTALVEVDARVGRHLLGCRRATMGTGDGRVERDFHGYAEMPPALRSGPIGDEVPEDLRLPPNSLPVLHGAGNHLEHRVRLGILQPFPMRIDGWIPGPQLPKEMLPFVIELSGRGLYPNRGSGASHLARVERISPRARFLPNHGEVRADGRPRRDMRLEPSELGMVAISLRQAANHRARQQRLTPQGDQALRIEIPGMQRPESNLATP